MNRRDPIPRQRRLDKCVLLLRVERRPVEHGQQAIARGDWTRVIEAERNMLSQCQLQTPGLPAGAATGQHPVTGLFMGRQQFAQDLMCCDPGTDIVEPDFTDMGSKTGAQYVA